MITSGAPAAAAADPDAQFNRRYIFAIALTAALGGLMFGYDWVVIGGAELFYEKYFRLAGDEQRADRGLDRRDVCGRIE